MPFKSADQILVRDSRFEGLVMIDAAGVARPVDLFEHHRGVGSVDLIGTPPDAVRAAFDRARNLLLYAFFDYEFLVNGELQAFGAVELALKHRLQGPGSSSKDTFRNLADRARKAGLFPKAPTTMQPLDRLGALVELRNALSHGTTDIHTPGAAMGVLEGCAWVIDTAFP